MHLTFRHMSALLIILYLLIPVMGLAQVAAPDAGETEIRSNGAVAGSPCGHCPCSDEQGSRCCNTDFCSCAFHSPPVQGVRLSYDPVVIIARRAESFWMLPQVYLSIFVPPQNQIPDRFPDFIVTERL
jgi:hypothetical protein